MMSKIMKVDYTEIISDCGECIHADTSMDLIQVCELTGSEIINYWDGILDDCPLEDKESES